MAEDRQVMQVPQPEVLKQAFEPIIGTHPRVVILGSLPGDASLAQQQYYAHPRNQFWQLLGDISGQVLHGLDYADKINVVQGLPVVVWDVVAQAQRQGSLDSAIREPQLRDLGQLLQQHAGIEQVWFNGQQAAKYGQHSLQDAFVVQVVLPSSSPAHTMAYETKRQYWQQAWDAVF